MSETKSRQIVIGIEPTFYDLLQLNADNVSAYVRKLIIADLVAKGTLDQRTMTKVLLGDDVVISAV